MAAGSIRRVSLRARSDTREWVAACVWSGHMSGNEFGLGVLGLGSRGRRSPADAFAALQLSRAMQESAARGASVDLTSFGRVGGHER
jgi:hypothetical protein